VTPLFGKIDSTPREVVVIEPHGHGITIDYESIQNVPTGRTFESVLGSSASVESEGGITIDESYVKSIPVPSEGFQDGEDPDGAGITFNGSEATFDEHYD
jgi:hypothetical protein